MTLLLTLLAIHIPLAALPAAGVDTSPNTSPTELLTVLEQPARHRRDDRRYVKRVLAAYAPTTGTRQELATQEDEIPLVGKDFLTVAAGDSLLTVTCKPTYSVIRLRNDGRTVTPFPAGIDTERLAAQRGGIRILEASPDGCGWVMLLGASGVIMHHEQTTRTFDLDWIDWDGGDGMHQTAFSWSPDSRKVAFYYAYAEGMRASPAVRDFGIALVTLDNGVAELVKPAGRRTALLGDEAIPPQWSSDSQYVYFIQGPVPGETLQPKVYPAFTYRVDIRTGQEEKLAQGTATSVAPDDSYLLLSNHCVTTEKGEVKHRSAKLDLRTRKIEVLTALVGLPRISPSGRYVAGIYRDKEQFVVRFFDASDWSMINDAGPVQRIGSMAEWFTFWHWITLDSPPQPAVPTTQP
ncbi:MAG: hypothetical protein GXY55_10420 [Phycisphaerae bacterium]|nr:hypothetical protein [Phycisphaerae bacterium]